MVSRLRRSSSITIASPLATTSALPASASAFGSSANTSSPEITAHTVKL